MLQVSPEELIEEVIYSPHLFPSEAKAIAHFVARRADQTQKWRHRVSDLLSPGENDDPSFKTFLAAMSEYDSEIWDYDTHATET